MMSDTAVFNPIPGVPTSGSVVIHDGYADSLPAYANVLETNFIKLFYVIYFSYQMHIPPHPLLVKDRVRVQDNVVLSQRH